MTEPLHSKLGFLCSMAATYQSPTSMDAITWEFLSTLQATVPFLDQTNHIHLLQNYLAGFFGPENVLPFPCLVCIMAIIKQWHIATNGT